MKANSENHLLEEWKRNQHEVVQNPNRRVRFTENFFQRFQGSVINPNNQFQVAVLAPQAALQYISGELLPNLDQYLFPKEYNSVPEKESTIDENDSTSEDSEVPEEDVEADLHHECAPDNGGCKLLGKYNKRAVVVLFVILEAISFVLDLVGKSKWNFLVAAFLLSAFAFAITIYTNCVIERSRSQLQPHHHCNDPNRQLRVVVEIVFSAVQLFVTSIHLILVNLDVKNNYNASVSPLVFAIIVLVFVFKKDDDGEVALTPNEEVTNISLNDINHVPSSTLSEEFLEEMVDENSYLMSCLVSRSSNLAPRNVEVHMFTTGVYKTIDLATLNCYEDLYKKVEELFNIEGQLFGFRSQNQLVYVGDDDFVLILGDDPWNEFCKVVKKIFIYIR
ncbi:hypothetical protein Ddye_000217 [Dipteronia dyeriana]|uniref:PB1 domain-containing protein n=1 Tax=Dipteronia dyeriana TaxID=168575 RepID=A0AAD9XMI6_9ROSI|nr:hypothetical protein Ddye_000217 [Dipteronia dyeriana]